DITDLIYPSCLVHQTSRKTTRPLTDQGEISEHTGAGGVSGEGSHLAESHNTIIGTSSGLPGSQASGIGEGSHFPQAHNTTARTSSGLIGNQTSRITNTSNTSTQNPAARDAAVAASGVGLAEHEHENTRANEG
ncbi:uncharacterized protein K444DRAFT_663843, partial [Hyaloscypha bicolor E]